MSLLVAPAAAASSSGSSKSQALTLQWRVGKCTAQGHQFANSPIGAGKPPLSRPAVTGLTRLAYRRCLSHHHARASGAPAVLISPALRLFFKLEPRRTTQHNTIQHHYHHHFHTLSLFFFVFCPSCCELGFLSLELSPHSITSVPSLSRYAHAIRPQPRPSSTLPLLASLCGIVLLTPA